MDAVGFRSFSFAGRSGEALPGFLAYGAKDFAIEFTTAFAEGDTPSLSAGTATFQVHTVQFVVGLHDGRVLYPFGYCPRAGWTAEELTRLSSNPGIVSVGIAPPLEVGASTELTPGEWSGWRFDSGNSMLVTSKGSRQPDDAFEIADGVVLGLVDDELVYVELTISVD